MQIFTTAVSVRQPSSFSHQLRGRLKFFVRLLPVAINCRVTSLLKLLVTVSDESSHIPPSWIGPQCRRNLISTSSDCASVLVMALACWIPVSFPVRPLLLSWIPLLPTFALYLDYFLDCCLNIGLLTGLHLLSTSPDLGTVFGLCLLTICPDLGQD